MTQPNDTDVETDVETDDTTADDAADNGVDLSAISDATILAAINEIENDPAKHFAAWAIARSFTAEQLAAEGVMAAAKALYEAEMDTQDEFAKWCDARNFKDADLADPETMAAAQELFKAESEYIKKNGTAATAQASWKGPRFEANLANQVIDDARAAKLIGVNVRDLWDVADLAGLQHVNEIRGYHIDALAGAVPMFKAIRARRIV